MKKTDTEQIATINKMTDFTKALEKIDNSGKRKYGCGTFHRIYEFRNYLLLRQDFVIQCRNFLKEKKSFEEQ